MKKTSMKNKTSRLAAGKHSKPAAAANPDGKITWPAHVIPCPLTMDLRRRPIAGDGGWGLINGGHAPPEITGMYAGKLSLAPGRHARNIRLMHSRKIAPEGYVLEMRPSGIMVKASDVRGYFYAAQTLLQLRRADRLPAGRISDAPALKIRGFHLMLESVRRLNGKYVLDLIRQAGAWKINTILLEYGDRFPYRRHPAISAPDALTRAEIRKINETARENHVNIIPLVQSLGHLQYVLKHREYAGLREVPGRPQQLCPANPGSVALFCELAGEVLAMHPQAQYFHVGGDETRQLGQCPRCAARAAQIGRGGIYLDHMSQICAWVAARGIRPIVWDDMLCAFPDVLKSFNRRVVIMYWDYWSGDRPAPYLVPRYRPAGSRSPTPGIAYDRRWDGAWRREAHPEFMRNFAAPIDMGQHLGSDFLRRFSRYLGADFPKWIRPFPYLEYYRDQGFTVIGAPTCLGEKLDLPGGLENQARVAGNIGGFARQLSASGGLGMITTAWFDFPPECLYHGLAATAQHAWRGNADKV